MIGNPPQYTPSQYATDMKNPGAVDGLSQPDPFNQFGEHPHQRGTTRGVNEVSLGQEAPAGGVTLKELVCVTCGQRSYTPDGICPYRDHLLHQVEDLNKD